MRSKVQNLVATMGDPSTTMHLPEALPFRVQLPYPIVTRSWELPLVTLANQPHPGKTGFKV